MMRTKFFLRLPLFVVVPGGRSLWKSVMHHSCFSVLLLLCLSIVSCSQRGGDRSEVEDGAETRVLPEEPSIPPSGLSGEELSRKYCSSCHAYVNPELLVRSAWKDDVLPAMGFRLGIYPGGRRPDSLFEAGIGGSIVRNAGIFPDKPLLAEEDWHKIEQYFLEMAPDTIPDPVRKKKIRMGLPHFSYRESAFSHRPPLTAMVKILPAGRGVVFSDGKGRRSMLTFLTPDLKESYTLSLPTTPVQFHERSNDVFLTTIGKGVFPNDAPDGTIQRLERNWPQPKYHLAESVLANLQRPVHIAYGDLNNDGQEDLVVCEFGNMTGRLSWFERGADGGYTKRILREKPGAIRAIIKDVNNDGLPDVYVLMGQGDEGIFLYENEGGGQFRERRLLTFSPLHGSQYFELADINKDGFDDIVYVCGDNADLTPTLKSYHGIYIFLNDRKNNFEQAYFYHMNGAYMAMVRDFDLDGDLDIAAISFFPDYVRNPEESFIYLRNTGNLRFEDYSFPEASKGRWVVMDAGDMDGDGDDDLVLGSFVYFLPAGDTTGLGQQWLRTSPSLIVLENKIR